MVSAALQFIIAGIAGFGNPGLSLWLRVIIGTLLWPAVMGLFDRLRTQVEIRPSSF
jgi:cell shape-determining protein MreD